MGFVQHLQSTNSHVAIDKLRLCDHLPLDSLTWNAIYDKPIWRFPLGHEAEKLAATIVGTVHMGSGIAILCLLDVARHQMDMECDHAHTGVCSH